MSWNPKPEKHQRQSSDTIATRRTAQIHKRTTTTTKKQYAYSIHCLTENPDTIYNLKYLYYHNKYDRFRYLRLHCELNTHFLFRCLSGRGLRSLPCQSQPHVCGRGQKTLSSDPLFPPTGSRCEFWAEPSTNQFAFPQASEPHLYGTVYISTVEGVDGAYRC